MEADVALRTGAGETWSMPPTGQSHAEATPGRGRKAKSKGRGLPQPVASPSPQQRSRRKQQQQQQQQQLRLSRSLDDELDAVVEAGNVKSRGRQQEITSSSRERLVESDIADALLSSGAATRRGSAPGQQSPSLSKLEKWTPKEQKKSSSRNRRRRAAAAAKKHEIGELEGGEGMAQAPISPEGTEPALFLDTQQGRSSRLPEPGSRKQEHRQPSMDSLSGRGPRKHSQQSDDGFFSYEPDYGMDADDQKPISPESPQVPISESRLKELAGHVQAPSGLPRVGFGYQNSSSDGSGRGRRRKKGGVGRVVPKPSGSLGAGSSLYGNDIVPSETGLGSDRKSSERVLRSEETPAFCEPQYRMIKDAHQKTTHTQPLADPHYGKSQDLGGRPSDQMYLRDPSLPPRGPNLLPFPSSSVDTGLPIAEQVEKSESVVILEVKDRPGMYYKSSVRTVSDPPGVGPPLDPAILASSASRFQPQPLVPQSIAPPQSIGSPRQIGPPQAVVPQQLQQFYSHPSYIPSSNLPHLGYNVPHPSLTPTQLTYSPQLNQSPLMSPQQQMFTPAKTVPLDLSFSPRNTPTAHSASPAHPMSHLDHGQLMYPPAPAHCPASQPKSTISHSHAASPSGGQQSKLPGLRRPNLSALQHTVSEDSPLDLSVKKTFPSSSACEASSTMSNQEGVTNLSPVTPPPLDLRTKVTSSNGVSVSDTSWSPCSAASTITEQPVGLPRGLLSADYTHVTSSQPRPFKAVQSESSSGLPVERQPVSRTPPGSNSTQVTAAYPEQTKLETPVSSPQPTPTPTATPKSISTSTGASSSSSTGQPHGESETAGFLNKSEFLQQRAGIKHDDIVVGPRRPISSMLTTPVAKLKDSSSSSQTYNTFPPSYSKPGVVQAEEDSSPPEDHSPRFKTRTEQKLSKTSELPSQTQPQDNQTAVFPTSSATEQSAPGGSQTIPRRIPRKIQPDSPHNPRRKAGGSRLPKPMHGHSPDRVISVDAKLSVAPTPADDTPIAGESFNQPHSTDASFPKEKRVEKSMKESAMSVELRPESAGHSESKPIARAKNQSAYPEPSNGDTNSADSSTYPGKSRQTKAACKSGLPQAVAITPPSKRKEAASKLHMLSNIPVPMCHDPRPKPAVQKNQEIVQEEEEEEASDKTPLLRPLAADSGLDNGHVADHTIDSQNDSAVLSSSSQKASSKQSFATNGSTHANGAGFERKKELIGEEVGLKTIPEQDSLDRADATSEKSQDQDSDGKVKAQNSPEVGKSGTRSTLKDQSEPPSPCHVTTDASTKLRLHRSAEQLGGQAKLSVFQPDAESATATSAPRTPVAASVPSSPGTHSELFKVGSYPTTSSASALLDSSSEIEKSPPIVKKKTNLPRIGILRRGSDRTAEICRRGSDRGIMAGIPLSSRRHDPSVEDLKRATSISELCQSVASLLNIDNEKAAAMITGDLSTREDLVEGLDADAIIDYLCHHGVLDTTALPDIDSKTSHPERNRALLQQVEGRGTTAVALFVNALRQSGQLHLASSLDTEQRIRPSTSGGYFGKGRHKGELTVRIEVEFLKILAPRELRPDKVVDSSLLNDQLDGVVVKEDDEDDQVKPRCWCFCLSSRRSKAKGRKKKAQSLSPPPDNSMERDAGEERQGKGKKQPKKSKEKNKGKKSSSSSKQDSQYQSAKYSLVEPTRDQVDGSNRNYDHMSDEVGSQHNRQRENKLTNSSTSANSVNGRREGNQSASLSQRDKSRLDPIIMEYDPKMELVKLRAGQDELASPTRLQPSPHHLPGGPETSVGMLVEQWKSSGPHFQRKATQLCARLVQTARDDLVRYFEQDRGTLVLDVVQDGTSVLVINICMQAAQVKCLKKDVADAEDEEKISGGLSPSKKKEKSALDEEEEEEMGLLDKLQSILFAHVDIKDFDIRGIKLHLALDAQQVDTALSELS